LILILKIKNKFVVKIKFMKHSIRLFIYNLVRIYKGLKVREQGERIQISRKMEFRGRFKTKTYDRKQFYLYNAPFYLETAIFWHGGIDNYDWELVTRRLWTHLCKQSSTIFDIGSNSGLFSVLAKVYSPNAKVTAFEPQPNVFEVLKMNNQVNGFDICCENLALSDEDGETQFYNYGHKTFSSNNTTAGSLNKSWRPKNQSSIKVSMLKLDSYILKNNLEHIDLMKIDVETFEFEVLSGYKNNIFKHQPIIILEVQDNKIADNIASFFYNEKYTYFNIDEENGLRKIEKLQTQGEHRNFLLIPDAKCYLLDDFGFMIKC
jgi:FkbM family methyltransferase